LRHKRLLIPIAALVAAVVVFAVLLVTGLLVLVGARGNSMAPTIPACRGRGIGEGFTYRFRDPHRGEIVVFHARGQFGGDFTPDPKASGFLEKRVVGIPGDTVVGRRGRVLVNDTKADDIRTPPFPRVHLGADEYFVLGDNRIFSQDSRDFGAVPRDAIFARTFLIYWPLGRLGVPGYDKTLVPSGDVCQ
jgi:signal peptidase I